MLWAFSYLLQILPRSQRRAHILLGMKITTLALVMVFALGCGCHAETTEEMVSSCEAISAAGVISGGQVSLPQDFDSGVCWGAFATIQTVITLCRPKTTSRPFLSGCVPAGSTRTQLIQVFLVYAQSHPEEYQKDYFLVALTSLRLHEIGPSIITGTANRPTFSRPCLTNALMLEIDGRRYIVTMDSFTEADFEDADTS